MSTRTLKSIPAYAPARSSRMPVPGRLMLRAWQRIERWRELSRERQALAALDDRLLRDIGLRRSDALREAARWFWDDPRSGA